MKTPPRRPWWQWMLAAAGLTAGLAGVVVLYLFDPTTAGFYPICPLHQATGLECPGCGTLRALHALTHGHLAEAWRFNAFFITLLPVGLWLALREAVRWTTGRQWPGIVTRPACGYIVAVGVVVWGVARNVPAFWR